MEDVKTSLNCNFINPDVTRLHAMPRFFRLFFPTFRFGDNENNLLFFLGKLTLIISDKRKGKIGQWKCLFLYFFSLIFELFCCSNKI